MLRSKHQPVLGEHMKITGEPVRHLAKAKKTARLIEPQLPWWQNGGSVYQIYPASFQQSLVKSDGMGDLPGIIMRLDYLQQLGVSAIWLSPFFTSPMEDFGYDVANYLEVDPRFGGLDDFKKLIGEADKRGIKVIIDLVLAHTSAQHPWFIESRSNQRNPKADWFVWADAKKDGTPPNNWLSIFGGPAWSWDTRRGQYYFHSFLKSQPHLNFHNRAMRQALLKVADFWLRLGVGGFLSLIHI